MGRGPFVLTGRVPTHGQGRTGIVRGMSTAQDRTPCVRSSGNGPNLVPTGQGRKVKESSQETTFFSKVKMTSCEIDKKKETNEYKNHSIDFLITD